MMVPFQPIYGHTKTLNATASSGYVTFTAECARYVVRNNGTVPVFIRTGETSATAVVASDMPILPGEVSEWTKPMTHNILAGITSSGTATLYVTPGVGI